MKLLGVQFMPGVHVQLGGNVNALSYWDLEKTPSVACEKQQNGDLILYLREKPRLKRRVHVHAIAWELLEDVQPQQVKK